MRIRPRPGPASAWLVSAVIAASLGLLGAARAQSPAARPPAAPLAILDGDHEFDAGSRVVVRALSPAQIDSLVRLGRVWGFLKYHHPVVTTGLEHWDYELFRVLPAVLAARDDAAAQQVLLQWVTALGPIEPCTRCATLQGDDIHLRPRVEAWLAGSDLAPPLAAALRRIYVNRPAEPKQVFVGRAPGVGNPIFEQEPTYGGVAAPDAGYQLLALFRLWNIVEYWFPYRDQLDRDWTLELTEFVPRVALAADRESLERELLRLVARVHDTHANLWSSIDARPPVGTCQVPVLVRTVEDRMVVGGYVPGVDAASTKLRVGDVIEAIDGEPVATLVERWLPFYAASNAVTKRRDIAQFLTRGACGPVALRVSGADGERDVQAVRRADDHARTLYWHDRPGPAFQRLSPDIAYLKLSQVKQDDAASYVAQAAGSKGLVIDIRNYPSAFMPFALGQRLVDRPTPFARFTMSDLANPGAFRWGPSVALAPVTPRYQGKVIVLVDERSQSQSEYTTMAFRAGGAVVVGSTTAGADGNVSPIPLPFKLRAMISGIGVFYPDKRPTQRLGIVSDVEAKPTIAGLRAGRDEVLEVAIRQILGPGAPAADIERLARRPAN